MSFGVQVFGKSVSLEMGSICLTNLVSYLLDFSTSPFML